MVTVNITSEFSPEQRMRLAAALRPSVAQGDGVLQAVLGVARLLMADSKHFDVALWLAYCGYNPDLALSHLDEHVRHHPNFPTD